MPKPNDAGLYFVDKNNKLVAEGSVESVHQLTEEDARRLGLLTEEKATAPAANKAVTGAPENKATDVPVTADTRKRR